MNDLSTELLFAALGTVQGWKFAPTNGHPDCYVALMGDMAVVITDQRLVITRGGRHEVMHNPSLCAQLYRRLVIVIR